MYKYELHLHSKLTSKCAASESFEYVAAAKEKGYAGMVFTNHFFRGNSAIDKSLPWRDFVGFYEKDYLLAKEEGERLDIDVIFGIEEGYGNGKECLIYGLTPEDFAECSDFPKMPIDEISAFVRSKNGIIACAHPYRARGYIKDSERDPVVQYFDAVEVYNAGNAPGEDDKALAFAEKHGLLQISGGDVHRDSDFGSSGIILPERVRDGKELVAALRKEQPLLITKSKK